MNRWLMIVSVLFAMVPTHAAEIFSWEEGLAAMRAGTAPAYCLYIGREKSLLLTHVRDGTIATAGVVWIRLGSEREVMNPFTGRTIPGSQQIQNLLGTLNELSGGSVLFLNRDGVIMPQFTLIQNFHKNRAEVLTLYCAMVADPLRDKTTIAEFARFKDMPIGKTLLLEVQQNKHRDFKWLFRDVPPTETYFKGITGDGRILDPRVDPAIAIVTKDPNGEVFLAQMREYWVKLAITDGGRIQRPPLVVLGPVGAHYPALDAQGIVYTAGGLTAQQLAPLSSPMTILPSDGAARKPIEIKGFIPGEIVGEVVMDKSAALLTNRQLLAPDIPFGDVDVEGVP